MKPDADEWRRWQVWLSSLDLGPVISELSVDLSLPREESVAVASARSPNVATWVPDVETSRMDPIDCGLSEDAQRGPAQDLRLADCRGGAARLLLGKPP